MKGLYRVQLRLVSIAPTTVSAHLHEQIQEIGWEGGKEWRTWSFIINIQYRAGPECLPANSV